MAMSSIQISPIRRDDVPLLLSFVRELAEYEKLEHLATATEADFAQALFGDRPTVEAVIARLDGDPVGCAIFFANFSTFLGKPGLYLEDLFVRPSARGAVSDGSCFDISRGLRSSADGAGSNGRCWTGTSRRLAFTRSSVRRRSTTGRSSA